MIKRTNEFIEYMSKEVNLLEDYSNVCILLDRVQLEGINSAEIKSAETDINNFNCHLFERYKLLSELGLSGFSWNSAKSTLLDFYSYVHDVTINTIDIFVFVPIISMEEKYSNEYISLLANRFSPLMLRYDQRPIVSSIVTIKD